jgi:CheY-like chemotaxis protein
VKSAADVPARPQYRKISPLQISLLFAAAGCLWILLSDRVLALFFEDPGTLTRFQTYKGWLFVITLASGLYVYLRRELARQAEQGSELDNVMRALDREKSRFEAIIAAMGTSFDIFLPAISSASGGRQVSAREEQAPGSGTILLAEDSPEVRNLARDILVSAGYSVIEAVDGEDALGKFAASSDRVHLLVLDVIMPRKDGKAVYAEIRRMNPHIKVLFISGYTADRLEQKGLTGTGVDGLLLQKPFVPSELLRKVETLLGAPAND